MLKFSMLLKDSIHFCVTEDEPRSSQKPHILPTEDEAEGWRREAEDLETSGKGSGGAAQLEEPEPRTKPFSSGDRQDQQVG